MSPPLARMPAMAFRTPLRQNLLLSRAPRPFTPLRTASTRSSSTTLSSSRQPLDPITRHRLEVQRIAYYKRRFWYSAIGCVCSMSAFWYTTTLVELPDDSNKSASKLDALPGSGKDLEGRKVVIGGQEEGKEEDVVQTGNGTVPTIPKVIVLGEEANGEEVEYQLLGHGIKTVSFLRIPVYVVGFYIATSDIAVLQQKLIQKIAPGNATTLVAGEKASLANLLKDPEESEKAWTEILTEGGFRSAIAVFAVRNTDFGHLRDGFMRGITARSQKDKEEYGDEGFGRGVNEFKTALATGKVPKTRPLVFARNGEGKMNVWFEKEKGLARIGEVREERLSRVIWLNFLSGGKPSCVGMRDTTVEGLLEFVERPVGTVAAQVHV